MLDQLHASTNANTEANTNNTYLNKLTKLKQVYFNLINLNESTVIQRPVIEMAQQLQQEGLAVASIARDDPSTLPGDDTSSLTGMHRDHNTR